jgi:hypothetical protein
MKKNRGEEPIQAICLEVPQGNSLIAILNKQNCQIFFCFVFFLLQNQRTGGTGPANWKVWYQWEG